MALGSEEGRPQASVQPGGRPWESRSPHWWARRQLQGAGLSGDGPQAWGPVSEDVTETTGSRVGISCSLTDTPQSAGHSTLSRGVLVTPALALSGAVPGRPTGGRCDVSAALRVPPKPGLPEVAGH